MIQMDYQQCDRLVMEMDDQQSERLMMKIINGVGD